MLEELGLGHVAPAFRSNAVTGSDLVQLSQQELQDLLGLTVLQARKVQGRVGCALSDLQRIIAPYLASRSVLPIARACTRLPTYSWQLCLLCKPHLALFSSLCGHEGRV